MALRCILAGIGTHLNGGWQETHNARIHRAERKELTKMVLVEIYNKATNEVCKRMGPMNDRKAERVMAGASINLNHDDFAVRIVPAETTTEKEAAK